MPTHSEILALARQIAREEVAPDLCHEWAGWSDDERRATMAAAVWYAEEFRARPPRQKAMRLFRSLLTPAQRRRLATHGEVRVRGTLGGMYRIWPGTGVTYRLERHGRRWFGVARVCLHDREQALPGPDVAAAHLLLIATDERAFRRLANFWPRRPQCWDGDYLRRMRRFRRERQREFTFEAGGSITAAERRAAPVRDRVAQRAC